MGNFSASALLLCSYLWYPLGSLLSFDLWCGAGLLLLQPTVRKIILLKVEMGLSNPYSPACLITSVPWDFLWGKEFLRANGKCGCVLT